MDLTAAAQLIAVEIEHPEYANLLNDIREFDWKLVNRLRKEDMARVHSTGFQFRNKGLDNQRKELQTFLLEHPSCMASDFEMIIQKLNIFGHIIAELRMEELNKTAKKKPKRKALKAPKPKVIEISEEEEDQSEDFVPEEDEEEAEEEDLHEKNINRLRSRSKGLD